MYNLDALKDVAKTIKHCGDYGNLFWNPENQKVWWVAGDGDGSNYYSRHDREASNLDEEDEEFTHTPEQIIEKFKTVPFVKEVEVEAECYPDEEDGWDEIDYNH